MVGFEEDHNEAYGEGKMAYVAGATLAACPYAPTSPGYRQWRAGWLDMNQHDPLLDDDERENANHT